MKVYVVRDGQFTIRAGEPASNLLSYNNFVIRYLSTFDEVVLVGRLFKIEDMTAESVLGPRVRFEAIPGYHGPLEFSKNVLTILRTIRRTIAKDAGYILRVPGTIGSIYSIMLYLYRIPFAVEVAGDPRNAYSAASLDQHRFATMFRWLFVMSVRWQCRNAVAVSYVTKEALQKLYPPRNKNCSFYATSIDLKSYHFALTYKKRENFNLMNPHLVLVGNMQNSAKGHDVLLKALVLVREAGFKARLTIVGFGANRPIFETMAKELKIHDNVMFLGKQRSGETIGRILDTADCFVLPSRQEGLPRALLEAMARGLPAIATRVGGTPELLLSSALVEPENPIQLADKLCEFFHNPMLMEQQAQRNWQVAKEYRVENVSKLRTRFYEYYRRIVEQEKQS